MLNKKTLIKKIIWSGFIILLLWGLFYFISRPPKMVEIVLGEEVVTFKINKKAFCCFFKEAMVFKLNGTYHQDALSLDGAELFDPSGKNRPMKEWVQVPFHYKDQWALFAEKAAEYVQ